MLEEARLQNDNKGRKMACTNHAPKFWVFWIFPQFCLTGEPKQNFKEKSACVPVTYGEVNGRETQTPPECEIMKEPRPSNSFRYILWLPSKMLASISSRLGYRCSHNIPPPKHFHSTQSQKYVDSLNTPKKEFVQEQTFLFYNANCNIWIILFTQRSRKTSYTRGK